MSTEIPKDKYNNFTREERGALFDLKNDKTIVITGAGNGSGTGMIPIKRLKNNWMIKKYMRKYVVIHNSLSTLFTEQYRK